MMNSVAGHVIGVPIRSPKRLLLLAECESKHHTCQLSNGSSKFRQLRLGPKITEMKGQVELRGKFSSSWWINEGFQEEFQCKREGEKLLKTFQCYLSTTGGPIAGLLFMSIYRIAFCSEKSIKIPSPTGELVKLNDKVSIPLRKIKKGRESTNVNMPSKKYIYRDI